MAEEQRGPNMAMFIDPVVYAVPGMDEVEVRQDVVYRTLDDGTALTMDVYRPPGADAGPRPGVVLIHGGPIPPPHWHTPKTWGVFRSYGRLLAASGFVAVAFNHRYVAFEGIEETGANIAAAFAFLRGGAAEHGLDPDRLAAWAFSGGGVLLGPLLAERPAWLRCVAIYYALMDLRAVQAPMPVPDLSGEVIDRFSPTALLPASGEDFPPLLVARAGRDWPWLNGSLDAFAARALAVNATIDVLNHPRGQHGFDVLDKDDRSREILARTVEFLRAHT